MEERTDGELLGAWRAGELGAFAVLVARHERALWLHARSLVGAGGAGDAVQEALLRLASRPPRLEVEGGGRQERAVLAGWLHRVLRRFCLDQLRGEARRRRREREGAPPEAVSGGQESVEAEDMREAVERELERLPQDQREVLTLRLLGERSNREIAEITGKKVGTVGWLVSEGLGRLAESLAHLMPAEENPRVGVQ